LCRGGFEAEELRDGPLVEEIKKMLGDFKVYLIEHVQNNNEVAHRLAKQGCGI
jgi:hypothetical protein